jgi:signal transduction histidine kinase
MDSFGLSHRKSRWETFHLVCPIQEAVQIARDKLSSGVELVVDLEPGLEALVGRGDAVAWRRLVSNLLVNSIRHTSSGTISLRVGATSEGVVLEVRDSGEGIAPHLLPWLGEPLLLNSENGGFGKSVRGNGMGLALCRRIVQRHGGVFCIRSSPGLGTRATATLRTDLPVPRPTDVHDDFFTQAGAP